jgi:hypothetical protein
MSCCGKKTQLPKVMTGTTTVGTMALTMTGLPPKANDGVANRVWSIEYGVQGE